MTRIAGGPLPGLRTLLLTAVILLAGCGQKGDLYLPEDDGDETAAAPNPGRQVS